MAAKVSEPGRADLIATFLQGIGWGQATRAPLAGDASFRRYERLRDGSRRAVLMDAPPGREDVRPFIAVARHLRGLGYSAPEIYESDPGSGLLLLEDLGDDTFSRLMGRGDAAAPLYAGAADLLADLHRRPEEQALFEGLKPYGSETFVREAQLFTEWYLPAVLDEGLDPGAEREFVASWRNVTPAFVAERRTLMMRDFFADNLMWLKDRPGIAACGLLDFQDAVAGPPAYDLVSLLEDARRDLPADLVAAVLGRYRSGSGQADTEAFDASYAVLGAQRHVRVLGVFTRLWKRDGKPGYLRHVPRLWRLLEGALEHPVLDPVKSWFDEAVPAERRIVPPTEDRR